MEKLAFTTFSLAVAFAGFSVGLIVAPAIGFGPDNPEHFLYAAFTIALLIVTPVIFLFHAALHRSSKRLQRFFVIAGCVSLAVAIPIFFLIALTFNRPSQQHGPIDEVHLDVSADKAYVALDTPSSIGGACEGWKTVEIRHPIMPAGSGVTSMLCWNREGDKIIVADETGSRRSWPASSWSDQ